MNGLQLVQLTIVAGCASVCAGLLVASVGEGWGRLGVFTAAAVFTLLVFVITLAAMVTR